MGSNDKYPEENVAKYLSEDPDKENFECSVFEHINDFSVCSIAQE